LLEALGSSAPKGIITSTLAMGFGCAMELNQWFYAPTPWSMSMNQKKAPLMGALEGVTQMRCRCGLGRCY